MWDPVTYLRFDDERARPFADLVARIDAVDPRTVVDLGCGPGTLTARLAHRWPRATVRGLDSSPEMVVRAAAYLIEHGPATPQERWEENSGYSPSTLAAIIAALTCAASFALEHGDEATAAFLQRHADFLASHVEAWTVTTDGTLVPGIPRHFVRIRPVDPNDAEPDEDPNRGVLTIRNRRPG